MLGRLIIFLLINFGALAIGGIFTSKGVPSDWYVNLIKAPWTPPGWVFGFAWTTIMICFTIYLSYLWPLAENRNLLIFLIALQWILNVGWNPIFFHYHHIIGGIITIGSLTLLIGLFLFYYMPEMKTKVLLLVPYLIWLIIATSLNIYIYVKN